VTRPAVFLDRDGTMIHDVGYLGRREGVKWFPWTADAIRLLNRAGFLVCVTTNQSGVGLGYYEEADVRSLHAWMQGQLTAAGAHVDGWYYCPHHPEARVEALRQACECRKPAPGMIRQASREWPIDIGRSYVIGDKTADVGLAARAGAEGILVTTGDGENVVRAHGGVVPDAAYVAAACEQAKGMRGRAIHDASGAAVPYVTNLRVRFTSDVTGSAD